MPSLYHTNAIPIPYQQHTNAVNAPYQYCANTIQCMPKNNPILQSAKIESREQAWGNEHSHRGEIRVVFSGCARNAWGAITSGSLRIGKYHTNKNPISVPVPRQYHTNAIRTLHYTNTTPPHAYTIHIPLPFQRRASAISISRLRHSNSIPENKPTLYQYHT